MATKVLHFIDSLGNGGAEHLLVNVVNALPADFENVIVILSNPQINLNSRVNNAEIINLKLPFSVSNFPKIIKSINKILEEKKITVVHSHSYWSNFISRFFRKNNGSEKILFYQSYHNAVYKTLWQDRKVRMLCWLDKLTLKKGFQYIAVSDFVAGIMKEKLGLQNVIVLKNFVNDKKFDYPKRERKPSTKLKLVSLGSFKREKNIAFVLTTLAELKELDIEYYIYGDGGLRTELEKIIREKELNNVYLMGITSDVLQVLTKYDVFIMPSVSEACPLAPLEAMQIGMPLLLSNIAPLKEIAQDKAFYFNPFDNAELKIRLRDIFDNSTESINADEYSEILAMYSKDTYLKKLGKLYIEAL